MRSEKDSRNFFLNLHPLHRILIGVLLSAITFVVIPADTISPLLRIMLVWIVFLLTFLSTSWVVLFKRSIDHIKKTASKDDGSKTVVFILIIISSFTTLFTVLLLMISKEAKYSNNLLIISVSVFGMILSWIMIHTIFTFHYAHMYYDEKEKKSAKRTFKGLDFPGTEEPDDIDFAYFSFVIGCTFQVSDVEITSRRIRRLVMFHGLLSFAVNTFVVALTINIIAGLR